MRPNHVNGRKWSDPYYNPLWKSVQKLGIPVGFHEAGRVFLPQPALSQFIPSFTMFNTLSFPMANMFACADMIYGGVMERFPKLKVAYLEGNCAWIPWLLWRMGEYAELTGIAEHPEMKLEPLEYFQRQCWGAVECDEVVARESSRLRPRRQHCDSQPTTRTWMSSIHTRWRLFSSCRSVIRPSGNISGTIARVCMGSKIS